MKRRSMFTVLAAAALALSVALAGCGKPKDTGNAGTDGNNSAPKSGGVLKIGMSADLEQPDPQLTSRVVDSTILQHIFSSLVKVNDKAEIVADLADKWEYKDPKTLVFTLHKGVKFHNGREFTADDVVFNYTRVMDPKTASPRRGYFASVDKVTATDPQTVTVTFKNPDASFVEHMSVIKIIAKENVADLAKNPIGTGPFKFEKWLAGQQFRMVKNPDYFVKDLPKLDAIEWMPMVDEQARVTALKTGKVDIIEQVPPQYIKELETGSTTTVAKVLGYYRDVLHFNTTKAPFDNVKVRQAISYAIDRDRIVKVIMDGEGQATQSLLNPGHWARKEYSATEGYTYDLNKAKALLKDAGAENLKATVYVDNRFGWNAKLAELLKDSLSQIGVTITIQLLEGAQFSKTVVTDRNYDMAFEPWNATVGDPDEFFYRQFHTGESVNFVNYSNKELDALLEKGRATVDQNERKVVYGQIQDFLLKEQPVAAIQHVKRAHGATKKVQNFKIGPDATIWLDQVTISQ